MKARKIILNQFGYGVIYLSIESAMAYGDKTGSDYGVWVDDQLYFSRMMDYTSDKWLETWHTATVEVRVKNEGKI